MMGLSRLQTILIIAIVALLVGNVLFIFIGYNPKASARSGLERDIKAAETQIATLESLRIIIGDNIRELAGLQEELAVAPIPTDIDDKAVVDSIIEAKRKAKLDGYTYEAEDPETRVIGENNYQAILYHISTSGRLDRLIKFLELIEENEQFNTLMTDNISFSSIDENEWELEFDIVIITQLE